MSDLNTIIYLKPPYQPEFPTTLERAISKVSSGELNAHDTFAWHEGLVSWIRLSELIAPQQGFSEHDQSLLDSQADANQDCTTLASDSSKHHESSAETIPIDAARRHGGITRWQYALILAFILFLPLGISVGMASLPKTVGEGSLFGKVSLAILLAISNLWPIAIVVASFFRLKNIGMNPWWSLVCFIPLLNLLVIVRGLLFQEGYEDVKRLDPAGKGIALGGIAVLLIGGLLLIVQLLRFIK